ncbi:MAG: SDR family oxidoreductase [Planctomycetota bacterium]
MSASSSSSDRPVALVTGGVRGIGRVVARRFALRGENVHVTWRSSEALARSAEAEFGDGTCHRADSLDAGAIQRTVEGLLDEHHRLDHVVHAVGEFESGPLEALGADNFRRMFQSNVETAFLLAEAVRPALRKSKGSLVFMGCAGLSGLRGRRHAAAYAAAKSALVVLARSLSIEEAPHGVRVNVCSPGIVPHEHAAADTHDPERLRAIPFGRAGTPEEVADAVLWLSSDEARYVTGADLPVAGGWLV